MEVCRNAREKELQLLSRADTILNFIQTMEKRKHCTVHMPWIDKCEKKTHAYAQHNTHINFELGPICYYGLPDNVYHRFLILHTVIFIRLRLEELRL